MYMGTDLETHRLALAFVDFMLRYLSPSCSSSFLFVFYFVSRVLFVCILWIARVAYESYYTLM